MQEIMTLNYYSLRVKKPSLFTLIRCNSNKCRVFEYSARLSIGFGSRLIESDWLSPGRTGINIYKNHRLIESKSNLIESLFPKLSYVNLTESFKITSKKLIDLIKFNFSSLKLKILML